MFPKIKSVFNAVNKIRRWYRPPDGKTTYQKPRDKKKKQIKSSIKELMNSDKEELKNIASLFKNNLSHILHYFISKESNAKAETLNRNLQRFINMNYGYRNKRFFHT